MFENGQVRGRSQNMIKNAEKMISCADISVILVLNFYCGYCQAQSSASLAGLSLGSH